MRTATVPYVAMGFFAVASIGEQAAAQQMLPKLVIASDDLAAGDEFGFSVDIDDDIIAVGARQFAFGGLPLPSGEVYLFDRKTGQQLINILPPDPDGQSVRFGSAVAVANGVVVVGAPEWGYFGSGVDNNAGAVFLYDASTGELLSQIILSGANPSQDRLGQVIDASGNGLLALGVPLRDLDGNNFDARTGSVLLYDISNPRDPALLVEIDPTADPGFGEGVAGLGSSVAMTDQGVLAVGADQDNTFGDQAGSAFLLDISDPASPVLLSKVFARFPLDYDQFGTSIAIDDDLLVVGADEAGTNGGSRRGFVTVFSILDPAEPVFRDTLVPGTIVDGDQFGESLALQDNLLAVGAPFNDPQTAYLFDMTSPSSPDLVGLLRTGGTLEPGQLGLALDIQGEDIVVGAPKTDIEGRVFVYANPLFNCPADLTGPDGSGAPDGVLDANDFFFYLSLFASGDAGADLTDAGGSGNPDGIIDANDFFFYLQLFAAGCP